MNLCHNCNHKLDPDEYHEAGLCDTCLAKPLKWWHWLRVFRLFMPRW